MTTSPTVAGIDLMELAAKVEAASGPDRALDADVSLTLFGDRPYGALTGNRHEVIGTACLSDYVRTYRDVLTADDALHDDVVPRFTASLDAAVSLVPANADAAGESFRLEAYNSSGVLAPHVRASAWVAGAPRIYAATPALALTAAALRARACLIEEERS